MSALREVSVDRLHGLAARVAGSGNGLMPRQTNMRLEEAIECFLLDCKARRLAAKTLRFYRQQLAAAVTWLRENDVQDLADVTPAHVRGYVVSLQARGLTPASQHAAVRALKAFLNFCERDDLLRVNPARKLTMPRVPRVIKPSVSLADVGKLIAACAETRNPQRDEAIVRMLVDTGLRAAELCALTVGDLTGRRVRVRGGKGAKDRVVFVGEMTRRALEAYLATRPTLAAGDPLFVSSETGCALTYEGLKQLLERLGARAGVDVHAHALRRTFAVESLRNGADLVRLARLMGHADLVMLQKHYLPLLEDDLAECAAKTAPGDKLGT